MENLRFKISLLSKGTHSHNASMSRIDVWGGLSNLHGVDTALHALFYVLKYK